MTLNEMKVGSSAKITSIEGKGGLRQHLLDMGVIPGVEVKLIQFAPMGDPLELQIHGYELTLRLDDAKKIKVIPQIEQNDEEFSNEQPVKTVEHPGFGEEGKYHVKADENPLPKDAILSFALAGNQNSGKTTLFNQLTGTNQHVGNFPGVTVDKKSGPIIGHNYTLVTDLPGIYSLSPYTAEEIVSREFILNEKPTGIINIVDATNIERNLYLTLQLMELNIPIVLALNMMDEIRGNGGTIDINILEEELGIPVVPISAAKKEGLQELIDHAIHISKYQERPGRTDFCGKDENSGAVHRCIHGIMHLIEDHAKETQIPCRFAATKIIEGDKIVENALNLTENEKEMIEHIIVQMEEERGMDRSAAIADMRFSFINKLCKKSVIKPTESKEHIRSRKIDKLLTGKFTAIPMFILIMAAVFILTFNVIGSFLQGLLNNGIQWLTALVDQLLTNAGVSNWLHSLVIDGIFQGVGSILSFIPIIIILFFFLSILEDSGYMARVAFVTDKMLRKLGLSGRSIVPMLIGFGCTVPGVMASRTLPSKRDRKMTIFLTPFMSCTAKLPIYGFFSAAFFPKYSGLIMIGLYLFGILVGILVALFSKKVAFKGEPVPFVMELPNYRMPSPKNVIHLLWEKTKDFLQRAFTIILIASVVIWFLQSFDFNLSLTEPQNSILSKIAGLIAPIFSLQGFGNWQMVTALIAGIIAKESVVSTLSVLSANVSFLLSPASALAFLVFCLLYTPCVASIAAIKRELGLKWTIFHVIFQCVLAWLLSLAVYALFSAIL